MGGAAAVEGSSGGQPALVETRQVMPREWTDTAGLDSIRTNPGKAVPFVVLQRMVADGSVWMLPTVQQAYDLLNFVEGALIARHFKVSAVVSWVAKWDGVGVIGVNLDNLEMFSDYRSFLEGVTNGGLKYTIIPKETVVQTSGLSTILKNDLRTITLADFPGM